MVDETQVKADAAKAEVVAEGAFAKFKAWAGIGDHRWYVAIAIALVVGALLSKCAG